MLLAGQAICPATIEPTGIQVASMSERPPISPRSPRAALEPEQVPPPPKRSERARNPFVIVGNAIITIILVVMIGAGGVYVYGKKMIEAPGPLRGRQDRQYSGARRKTGTSPRPCSAKA